MDAPLDREFMDRAIAAGDSVRGTTAPNPWVGCVIVSGLDPAQVFEGATAPPGGPHAEVTALARAGELHARGATLFTTLEPCAHHGRTPPCTDAIIAAGVARVVIAIEDPDPQVAGQGVAALRAAGIEVSVGTAAAEVTEQLAPYLKHRTTGRPWVVLKMAASLDARTAAPDGTSRWITGEEARRDVHRLRARSDAILVGAGTVRADDPELTVRLDDGPTPTQPLRVVLGAAPPGRRSTRPSSFRAHWGTCSPNWASGACSSCWSKGERPWRTISTRRAWSIDMCCIWPRCFLVAMTARPIFAGPGAGTIGEVWRGKLVSVERLGVDLRVEVAA